jgi:hypothetical protein
MQKGAAAPEGTPPATAMEKRPATGVEGTQRPNGQQVAVTPTIAAISDPLPKPSWASIVAKQAARKPVAPLNTTSNRMQAGAAAPDKAAPAADKKRSPPKGVEATQRPNGQQLAVTPTIAAVSDPLPKPSWASIASKQALRKPVAPLTTTSNSMQAGAAAPEGTPPATAMKKHPAKGVEGTQRPNGQQVAVTPTIASISNPLLKPSWASIVAKQALRKPVAPLTTTRNSMQAGAAAPDKAASAAVNGGTNGARSKEAPASVVPDPDVATTSFSGDAASEAQEMELSPNHVPCDHPVPEAPGQDAARSEAVASPPTEGTAQADKDLTENASTSSSAEENAPADSGAAEAVPRGKVTISGSVGEQDRCKGSHELVKLDSDAPEELIKSAVVEEQAPQDQLSTSSKAAVSEPGPIRQSSNEEMLSIHIGWQELP